ncbi:hypothetical protein ACQVP2_27360 [Methylobacterium aquaticum]|uniref:hypothetical protein n=1 Tax=Methylobacterium aquaticum TaxID=270351 RepID=UPI003D16CA28
MLTADQHARLPALLRDIVDHDRQDAGIREFLAAEPVVSNFEFQTLRRRRRVRQELRVGARHLYGRAPLRGDTGPGRPTAARA